MCYASGSMESMNSSLQIMQEASGRARLMQSPRNHITVVHPLDEPNSLSETALIKTKCP